MRILSFGTYNSALHPRVKILIEGLRENGHQVVELNYPTAASTADKVEALKSVRGAFIFSADLAVKWRKLTVGAQKFRGKNAPDAILAGYMGHFDVLLARMLFPRTPIILDHLIFASNTVEDRGINSSAKDVAMKAIDRLALKAADIIVVDTEAHHQLVPEKLRSRALVIPVGAPREYFEARKNEGVHNPLRVIFYGLFTPLQGTPFIASALKELDQMGVSVSPILEVTMVGSGQDYEHVKSILQGVNKNVNITWKHWVEHADLPGLVANHDICLGIFGTSAKAQSVVPNKVYQGMAAGCAVITSDTEAQRNVLGDSVIYCSTDNPSDLTDVFLSMIKNSEKVDEMKKRGAELADQKFSAKQVTSQLSRNISLKLAGNNE